MGHAPYSENGRALLHLEAIESLLVGTDGDADDLLAAVSGKGFQGLPHGAVQIGGIFDDEIAVRNRVDGKGKELAGQDRVHDRRIADGRQTNRFGD